MAGRCQWTIDAWIVNDSLSSIERPSFRYGLACANPNFPGNERKMNSNYWMLLDLIGQCKTISYRNATLSQRLNYFVLIGSIELEPFWVDRLHNCVFREFDQHEPVIVSKAFRTSTDWRCNTRDLLVQSVQVGDVCVVDDSLIVYISEECAARAIFLFFQRIVPVGRLH